MSSNRGGARQLLSAWLPVVFFICVIACESTAYFGADRTNGPLRHLWEWIFGRVSDDYWHFQHIMIRKSGHFIGYGLMGLTWLRACRMTRPQTAYWQNALLALAGTALVSSADEYHQTFLPNRTGAFHDVVLDCLGAAVLMSAVWMIGKLRPAKPLARAA